MDHFKRASQIERVISLAPKFPGRDDHKHSADSLCWSEQAMAKRPLQAVERRCGRKELREPLFDAGAKPQKIIPLDAHPDHPALVA
jgi:hypothetical protein